MFNERQIELLPERITTRLTKINNEYLQSIGEVIKDIGELRPSDVHKLQRMYSYGTKGKALSERLAKTSETNIKEIYEIFDLVAKENYNYAKPFYEFKKKPFIPYEENEYLKKYVNSLAKQTVNEYVNLTQHTAFAVFDKDGKSIAPLFMANKDKVTTSLSETYTKVIDYAVTKVQTGVIDYNSAMRDCLKALADSGIKTVDYATRYSRRLDTAVRQNILWGIKECNQNVADFIGEDFGADGYEISYHSHPRESHEKMAGQQYAKGKARTVNGVHYPSFSEIEHLLQEHNCLHFKFSIILGVSQPAYKKSELARFKAEDKKLITFEGKTYTKYEASQLQRRIESEVRHQKDRSIIAKAAGDTTMQTKAQLRINQLTDKYAALSDASGLPTKMERMNVRGFKTINVSKTVDKSSKSGIINTEHEQSPRKMLKGDFSVDWSKIQDKSYNTRLHYISNDDKVVDAIETRCKWALNNRNLSKTEELYAIDLSDGSEISKIIDQYNDFGVKRTPRFDADLKNADREGKKILLIHNHPRGLPPSIGDINALLSNENISGITAGHDGSIYYYTKPHKNIPKFDYSVKLRHYKDYDEITNMEKALEDLQKQYGFIIKKL